MRKLTGIFLLAVFVLGITPVALLHDLIANHKDICYHHFQDKGSEITKADINCHCISFVAEARFLNSFQSFSLAAPATLSLCLTSFCKNDFYSQPHFFAELRGPPALC